MTLLLAACILTGTVYTGDARSVLAGRRLLPILEFYTPCLRTRKRTATEWPEPEQQHLLESAHQVMSDASAEEPFVVLPERHLKSDNYGPVSRVFFAYIMGTTLSNVSSKMAFNSFGSSFTFVLQVLQLVIYSSFCFLALAYKWRRFPDARAAIRATLGVLQAGGDHDGDAPRIGSAATVAWRCLLRMSILDACALSLLAAGAPGTPGPLITLLTQFSVVWNILIARFLFRRRQSVQMLSGAGCIGAGVVIATLIPALRAGSTVFVTYVPAQVACTACSSLFMSTSACYKEYSLKQRDLDPLALTAAVSALQIVWMFPIFVTFAFASQGYVVPYDVAHFGQMLRGGLSCAAGAHSIELPAGPGLPFPGAIDTSCAFNTTLLRSGKPCCALLWQFSFYATAITSGISLVMLYKRGSAVLAALAQAACLPPSTILYAVNVFSGESFPSEVWVGLVLVVVGLVLHERVVAVSCRADGMHVAYRGKGESNDTNLASRQDSLDSLIASFGRRESIPLSFAPTLFADDGCYANESLGSIEGAT